MHPEFASPSAFFAYAEQNAFVYLWERSHAFNKRAVTLSPEQYQIVAVQTSRGTTRAMLFSKEILRAEWEADEPFRKALAIKRTRWQTKRQEKERLAAERAKQKQ